MKFYARVGDEEYFLLDKSFEDAVVTFWFWTAVRTERGEIPPGRRGQVTELALAYQRGALENAEVATLPILEGEALRRELRAYLRGPAEQATQPTLEAFGVRA
jgi:hypothetical protein